MSYQSLKAKFLERSRQVWQTLSGNQQRERFESPEQTTLHFLEQYHCQLFPQQTIQASSKSHTIVPLKVRTAELILKQIHLYYLPKRLESLLPYCDPFTAVATFLNALNFSYQGLLRDSEKNRICQGIIQELSKIDDSYHIDTIVINEIPLYEAAATHDMNHFQKQALAFQKALEILNLLDRNQVRNHQIKTIQISHYWHHKKIQNLEKMLQELSH